MQLFKSIQLINIAIYSSNNSIFKPFDIHSSINSVILYVGCLYIGILHNTVGPQLQYLNTYIPLKC